MFMSFDNSTFKILKEGNRDEHKNVSTKFVYNIVCIYIIIIMYIIIYVLLATIANNK